MTTEEEVWAAAQAKLDAAVVAYAQEMGYDGFCDSYIMVMHQQVLTVDGSINNSRYPVVMMGGHQPDHVCLGLLNLGLDRIHGTGIWGKSAYEES